MPPDRSYSLVHRWPIAAVQDLRLHISISPYLNALHGAHDHPQNGGYQQPRGGTVLQSAEPLACSTKPIKLTIIDISLCGNIGGR